MQTTTLCQGCLEQMRVPVPIRGPFSIPLRLFGIKQTKMHPNLCTVCELMFTRVMKRRQISIETTILFADLRGYTTLSEEIEPSQMTDLLHCFYDHCSNAVWEHDGIINKFIGDAVLAIFNFPLVRKDHVRNAVLAGKALQQRCLHMRAEAGLAPGASLGVGVGIHTGTASIGEIGTSYKEFTAIGPVVNLASRIQGSARAGEVLVTEDVYRVLSTEHPDAERRSLTLKGIDRVVDGYVLAWKPAASA